MRTALYLQIAQDLAGAIASGHYPVGELLPTEIQLCERYGTSRHTVREALRELQELGLVSRRKKVGTKVEAKSPSGEYRQSLASLKELTDFGAKYERMVQSVKNVVIDRELSRELGCPPGMRFLRISSLRMINAETPPVGWTDVYLDPAFSGIADMVRQEPQPLISSLIEQHYGRRISSIQQDIAAVLIPENLAMQLKTAVSSPALKIIRRYFDSSDKLVELSVTFHPADRFVFSTSFDRSQS